MLRYPVARGQARERPPRASAARDEQLHADAPPHARDEEDDLRHEGRAEPAVVSSSSQDERRHAAAAHVAGAVWEAIAVSRRMTRLRILDVLTAQRRWWRRRAMLMPFRQARALTAERAACGAEGASRRADKRARGRRATYAVRIHARRRARGADPRARARAATARRTHKRDVGAGVRASRVRPPRRARGRGARAARDHRRGRRDGRADRARGHRGRRGTPRPARAEAPFARRAASAPRTKESEARRPRRETGAPRRQNRRARRRQHTRGGRGARAALRSSRSARRRTAALPAAADVGEANRASCSSPNAKAPPVPL